MLLKGLQVRKNKPIPLDDLSHLDCDRRPEHRAIIDKRMEFTVLAAGVHSGGKVLEKTESKSRPANRGTGPWDRCR